MLKRLIDFGIFSILFFSSVVIFKKQLAFEFYINYVPLIILLLIFTLKYSFPTQIFYILVPLLIFGLVNIFLGNDTLSDFLKIYSNIFIGILFFYASSRDSSTTSKITCWGHVSIDESPLRSLSAIM